MDAEIVETDARSVHDPVGDDGDDGQQGENAQEPGNDFDYDTEFEHE
jgi:hypothetical protein